MITAHHLVFGRKYILPTNVVASSYSVSGKWVGGVLAPNGKIYFTPYSSSQILELNPNTLTTQLVGSSYSGSTKWVGGVLAPNGKIYFTSFFAFLSLFLSTFRIYIVFSFFLFVHLQDRQTYRRRTSPRFVRLMLVVG